MSKKRMIAAVAVLGLCVAYTAHAEDKEFKATCPVSGQPAKEGCSVDYKGGKIYFCCGGCPGAFQENTAKYAAKANRQLVATGQAKLVKCPLSGGNLNPETGIEVGGVKVCFCCNNCKGKVAAASGDDQVKLVFGDEAFAKGFEVKKQ